MVGLLTTSRRDLCQHLPSRTGAAHVLVPTTGHCQSRPPQDSLSHSQAKDLNDPDNHNGVIPHLESNKRLECEVKWVLKKPYYEQSSCSWWNSSWAISNSKIWCYLSAALNIPEDWKRSVLVPIAKEGDAKERSDYCTIALTTLASTWSESALAVTHSLRPHRLYIPWNSLGQNTRVGSLSLLQGIFPTQGLNPGLPHCGRILCQLSHKGSPHASKVMLKILQARLQQYMKKNLQTYKLDLEKAEGTETKLPTPLDPRKSKGIQKKKKTSTAAPLTMLKPLCRSQ